ncbi:hypothetical protein Esti_006698 [Eimeria stiedai]
MQEPPLDGLRMQQRLSSSTELRGSERSPVSAASAGPPSLPDENAEVEQRSGGGTGLRFGGSASFQEVVRRRILPPNAAAAAAAVGDEKGRTTSSSALCGCSRSSSNNSSQKQQQQHKQPHVAAGLKTATAQAAAAAAAEAAEAAAAATECVCCKGGGSIRQRLFADTSGDTEAAAPTEGTAGHVQARCRPIPSRPQQQQQQQQQLQQQEELEAAACEVALGSCLQGTFRALRLTCFFLTPLLLFLLVWGPSLFSLLPPSARHTVFFIFPAFKAWAVSPGPPPSRSYPFQQQQQQGFFASWFCGDGSSQSQYKGKENACEGPPTLASSPQAALPSIESLRSEFAAFQGGRVGAPEEMVLHAAEFRREIIEVAHNVYAAVGFGLANCFLLRGPKGIIVVDTMESVEAMRDVWAAWKQYIRNQQQQQKQQQQEEEEHVVGIIYTHFHTDHIFGASAVFEPGITEVHAHWLTRVEIEKLLTVTASTTYRRGMRQFGVYVHPSDFVHAGIGPFLRYNSEAGIGTVLPTHVFKGDSARLELGGIDLLLLHAPGESRDQVVVWLPHQKVLIGADNLYKAFPNVYAIRGTETRDCNAWVASLELMRSLHAEVLLLGHARPLVGAALIWSTLTVYRDAIQYVHDQTVRLINKGYPLAEIVQQVELPRHLRDHPYLRPLYGTVPWAVRAIFTHYLGWFTGDDEELTQPSPLDKASALEDLAGGQERLLLKALASLRSSKPAWALHFAAAACLLHPDNQVARELKVVALRSLASQQTAASGRNWYLTAALEAEGSLDIKLTDTQKKQLLQRLSVSQILSLLPVRVNPEAAETVEATILFRFSGPRKPAELDSSPNAKAAAAGAEAGLAAAGSAAAAAGSAAGAAAGSAAAAAAADAAGAADGEREGEEMHCVHFRRGVVYIRHACETAPNAVVETNARVWRQIIAKEASPLAASARGDIKIQGSVFTLIRALAAVELDAD